MNQSGDGRPAGAVSNEDVLAAIEQLRSEAADIRKGLVTQKAYDERQTEINQLFKRQRLQLLASLGIAAIVALVAIVAILSSKNATSASRDAKAAVSAVEIEARRSTLANCVGGNEVRDVLRQVLSLARGINSSPATLTSLGLSPEDIRRLRDQADQFYAAAIAQATDKDCDALAVKPSS